MSKYVKNGFQNVLKIYPWKPDALQSDQTDEVDNDQIKTLPEYNQHDTHTQKYSNQVLKTTQAYVAFI